MVTPGTLRNRLRPVHAARKMTPSATRSCFSRPPGARGGVGSDALARDEVDDRLDRAVVAAKVSHEVSDATVQLDHRVRFLQSLQP
jgi:hypothetical protein